MCLFHVSDGCIFRGFGNTSAVTVSEINWSITLDYWLEHITVWSGAIIFQPSCGCCKHTQSLCKSIIADEVPPYEQAGAYGKLAAISGLGFIVGPVIGGHIADHEHGFSFITMIILVCFWINIEKYGMTPKSVGYIISFQSIIGSGTSFLSGQIQHIYEWRYPPQKASAVQIVHCFIAMTAGLVGVSFVDSTLGLLLALMPLASGAALLRTLLTELLVQKASPQERGSLLGASHSFSAMSRLTTPVIAGIASDWYGTSAVSSLSQIGATVGAIAAHRILKGEYLEHYVS
ncbi:hypothetical protein FOCC_FOCC012606 [Frankliniella occidentalis]|nr:hypothetical protein FOCC_FOCC012606 [Frankliniella occidentalis]